MVSSRIRAMDKVATMEEQVAAVLIAMDEADASMFCCCICAFSSTLAITNGSKSDNHHNGGSGGCSLLLHLHNVLHCSKHE